MTKQDDGIDRELEIRLEIWGRWLDRIALGEEGWPSQSIIELILKLGHVEFLPRGPRLPFYINKIADEINGQVITIKARHPEQALALQMQYTRTHGKRIRDVAREMGVPLSTFRSYVRAAKEKISHGLELKNLKKSA
jgi:hypothetical protein